MQVTVMCPGCARLLTIKVQPPDHVEFVCPTCGWEGKLNEKGKLVEAEEQG